MAQDILIPAERGIFTHSLRRSLIRYLNATDNSPQHRYNLREVSLDDFNAPGTLDADRTALLILPGINGDISPYPQRFRADMQKRLLDALHSGVNIFGLCAGAYYLSRHLAYERDQSLTLVRTNHSALFNGLARGPLRGYARHDHNREDDYDLSDITSLAIDVISPSGHRHPMYACYGNGPVFQGYEEQYETLARYRDLKGAPPAIISIKHGAGEAILSGIHSEINLDDMRSYYHYKQAPHIAGDLSYLHNSEDKRKMLQVRLWQRLCP
jgi:glutamine amidotransferase-like uncharacterized protein